MTVEISEETARVAHQELELLIEQADEMEQDPLRDELFRARAELAEELEAAR